MRQCYVTLTITSPQGEVMPTRVLGEFKSTWKEGVSIGSDPKCTIVLEGLAPAAAIVLAASNPNSCTGMALLTLLLRPFIPVALCLQTAISWITLRLMWVVTSCVSGKLPNCRSRVN